MLAYVVWNPAISINLNRRRRWYDYTTEVVSARGMRRTSTQGAIPLKYRSKSGSLFSEDPRSQIERLEVNNVYYYRSYEHPTLGTDIPVERHLIKSRRLIGLIMKGSMTTHQPRHRRRQGARRGVIRGGTLARTRRYHNVRVRAQV